MIIGLFCIDFGIICGNGSPYIFPFPITFKFFAISEIISFMTSNNIYDAWLAVYDNTLHLALWVK